MVEDHMTKKRSGSERRDRRWHGLLWQGANSSPALVLFVVCGGKPAQRLDRWDEGIGPSDCRRLSGPGVTDAVLRSRHPIAHAGQATLVAAEANEHRPMLSRCPERGIAAEDVLFDPV